MKLLNALLLTLIVLFASSCNTADIGDENLNSSFNYKLYKISQNTELLFHGYIKAQHRVTLSFQNEGRIVYMPYSTGDFVKKGQVLARLDGSLYEIQKNEETARLKEMQIQQSKYNKYYNRVDILHKAGAISDNDWEEAFYNLKTSSQNINIQKQKINLINKQISYNTIVSPYDGYILEKLSDVGAQTAPFSPVLSLISSDKTEADVMVDSSVINLLKINQNATLKRDSELYDGKIAYISKTSLNSGGYLVRIFLNNLNSDLKEGMSVDVSFDGVKSKILIPVIYLNVDKNTSEKFVYVAQYMNAKQIKAQKRTVATGNIKNNLMEIKSGLDVGDTVIYFSNNNIGKDEVIINL